MYGLDQSHLVATGTFLQQALWYNRGVGVRGGTSAPSEGQPAAAGAARPLTWLHGCSSYGCCRKSETLDVDHTAVTPRLPPQKDSDWPRTTLLNLNSDPAASQDQTQPHQLHTATSEQQSGTFFTLMLLFVLLPDAFIHHWLTMSHFFCCRRRRLVFSGEIVGGRGCWGWGVGVTQREGWHFTFRVLVNIASRSSGPSWGHSVRTAPLVCVCVRVCSCAW